ncbi:MAG: hypothetical protein H6922_03790 [Pseudomonadaceae bacterium]|nr:hypothetical protein [Pseudomonadaceae bacterium]
MSNDIPTLNMNMAVAQICGAMQRNSRTALAGSPLYAPAMEMVERAAHEGSLGHAHRAQLAEAGFLFTHVGQAKRIDVSRLDISSIPSNPR